jgi:ELWxxDGT repeat protein
VTPLDGVASTASLGGTLFFIGYDRAHGTQLWVTDGTAPGTTRFTINPQGWPPPFGLTAALGRVFFIGDDGVHGRELWQSDGTTARMVADINPGAAPGLPAARDLLAAIAGWLYFAADDGRGLAIWRTDGTTVERVTDLAPDLLGIVAYHGALYFSVHAQLYRLDP